MTDLDISQWKWTETLNGNTSNELLTLKKNLANDVVDKLFEKDSNFVSALFKGSVVDYLVDENTINDALHDEVLEENNEIEKAIRNAAPYSHVKKNKTTSNNSFINDINKLLNASEHTVIFFTAA